MKNILIYVILIILVIILFYPRISGFANYVAHYQSSLQKGWWNRPDWRRFGFPYYSYWETFENPNHSPIHNAAPIHNAVNDSENENDNIMNYPPDTPSPADLSMKEPYHLLGDEFTPPRKKESISCVNSRSCYAVNFDRMIDKVSNYRQFTNNYQRGYPDSCSAPYQELVLNFYKADPMKV
jgi:hypothetical protein